MSLTEINIREKKFHNNLQSKKGERFENIFYKAIYNVNEDFLNYLRKNVENSEVLDYGCGQGDDIIALKSAGYNAEGWDPYYRPDPSLLKKADITNLGFVLNVIEDLEDKTCSSSNE